MAKTQTQSTEVAQNSIVAFLETNPNQGRAAIAAHLKITDKKEIAKLPLAEMRAAGKIDADHSRGLRNTTYSVPKKRAKKA